MPELLGHLLGDYVFQNHKMATRKTSSWKWAGIHAAIYTFVWAAVMSMAGPNPSDLCIAVVGLTHVVIDRYRLAGYWCRWYGVGYGNPEPPPFLQVWLLIIVDNTIHLTINHLALNLL